MQTSIRIIVAVICAGLGSAACSRRSQEAQHTSRAVGTTGQETKGTAGTIYGTPGAPSATTTIDGVQLPPPPQTFGGTIERNAFQSKPYWPARVVPPKG